MRGYGPGPAGQGFVAASCRFLLGAVAVYVAVQLLISLWPYLLLGAVIGSGAGGLVAIHRRRSRGW